MKTSWKGLEDVFRFRLQKTSSRRLHQDKYICLTHTSSEDVFKMSWRRKIVTLKTYWRRLQDMSSRRLQDVLKTNKRLLGNALAKISIKRHNTLKQCSNLLSTSHNLGSKHAYNVYKSKNKFWFRETSWKSDTGICFYYPY